MPAQTTHDSDTGAALARLADALNYMSGQGLHRVIMAFGFMKGQAIKADIPYAGTWQLDFDATKIGAWRVTDTGAQPGEGGDIAFTLAGIRITDALGLAGVLEAYGRAFRAMCQIGANELPGDLVAASRRDNIPAVKGA